MHCNISYISEESLKELASKTIDDMQEHKVRITKLSSENMVLKRKEEILNNEIAGIYLHIQAKVLFEICLAIQFY